MSFSGGAMGLLERVATRALLKILDERVRVHAMRKGGAE